MERELTGKFVHKKNFWGSLVLFVEIRQVNVLEFFEWRKATEIDVKELNLKSESLNSK